MDEQTEKGQLKESQLTIQADFEVDPSFPEAEKPGIEKTLEQYQMMVEGGLIENPKRKLKIKIFPEEKFGVVNAYLESIGHGKVGKAKYVRLENGTIEIFLPFGKTIPAEEVREKFGHELAHSIEGEREGLEIVGGTEKLIKIMRKPIGLSERRFLLLKELLKRDKMQPICFENMGMTIFVKSVDQKGKVSHWLVYGYALNEFVASWLGGVMSGIPEEIQIMERFSSVVGSGLLAYSYLSGDLSRLEKVFQNKTGHSLEEFARLLDDSLDILKSAGESEEAIIRFKTIERQTLNLLEGSIVNVNSR